VLRLQDTILDLIARGESLEAATRRLCLVIEVLLPGVICSVLRFDRNGLLHPFAGPKLPQQFSALIDGVMIGPGLGSRVSVAFHDIPVTVTDIDIDPRWNAFKIPILAERLNAWWPSPVRDADGSILGTFAFYFEETRGPNGQETASVDACTDLCDRPQRHDGVLDRERRASTDALTDLPNRANFNGALAGLSCADPGTSRAVGHRPRQPRDYLTPSGTTPATACCNRWQSPSPRRRRPIRFFDWVATSLR
jgi:hypothetical protein